MLGFVCAIVVVFDKIGYDCRIWTEPLAEVVVHFPKRIMESGSSQKNCFPDEHNYRYEYRRKRNIFMNTLAQFHSRQALY